jgi:hypothetical protein
MFHGIMVAELTMKFRAAAHRRERNVDRDMARATRAAVAELLTALD